MFNWLFNKPSPRQLERDEIKALADDAVREMQHKKRLLDKEIERTFRMYVEGAKQ